jgi:4-amino-4-deoxy-L-arabinose transferase-like glycosyltransferase
MSRNRWIFWALLTIVLVIAAISLYAYGTRTYTGLVYADSMRYASVARSFLRGEGFAWKQYIPYELATEGYNPDKHYPHFLHPLIIAGAMRLFGERDISVALASAIPTILATVLIFLIGKTWFDERVALVAALMFALSELTLLVGISGLSEPLFTLLFVLSVFCFAKGLRKSARRPLSWIACAGAILGLEQAVRPVGIYYMLPYLLILVTTPDRRWRGMATLVASFFLLFSLTAWVGEGRFLPVGDPSYGLLTGIGEYREKYDFHRSLVLPPSPLAYTLSHMSELIGKILASAYHYVQGAIPGLGGGSTVVGMLFVASWLVRYREPALNKVRALILLLMATQVGVNLLLWPTDRYFLPFIPFVTLFASDYIWRIVDTLRAAREPQGRHAESIG